LIGVLSNDAEKEVVQEFFQLFKTPWEFYNPDRPYDAVLCAREGTPPKKAKLLMVFGSETKSFDSRRNITPGAVHRNAMIEWNDLEIPVYGDLLTFESCGFPVIRVKGTA
jgi:hypothetical protein